MLEYYFAMHLDSTALGPWTLGRDPPSGHHLPW